MRTGRETSVRPNPVVSAVIDTAPASSVRIDASKVDVDPELPDVVDFEVELQPDHVKSCWTIMSRVEIRVHCAE